MAQDILSETSVAGSNVFISYCRKDMDFANQIVSMLEDEGYDPKIDRDDIAATEQWEARLQELISSSDTVVFVLTDDYLASQNCGWEIQQAVARNKRLIPLLPKPLTAKDVPPELSRLNYIHFFSLNSGDGTGFYAGFKSLQRALRHDLERLRLLRRYEERAKEWKSGGGVLLTGEQLVQAQNWQAQTEKIESVPQAITAYIDASQIAHVKRLKKERARVALLGGLSIASALATIAAIIVGFGAWVAKEEAASTLAELNVQTDDMKVIVGAAEQWASGRQSLALNKHEIPEDYESQSENATRVSGRMLEDAYDKLNSRDSIVHSEADHVVFIRQSVRRDLAKARFYNGNETAVIPIDENIAELTAFAPEQKERFSDYSQVLAEDFVSRAVYSCLASDRINAIGAQLAEAPEEVRKFISWRDAEAREKSGVICDEAKTAVCSVGQACDYDDAPFDQIAMIEPSIGDVVEEAPSVTQPPPVTSEPIRPGSRNPTQAPPRVPSRTVEAPAEPVIEQAKIVKDFEITEVYLHISDKSQYADAQIIANELKSAGFKVLGIDVVDYDPAKARSVRYYYDPQAEQSAYLAAFCAKAASQTGRAGWSDAGNYRVMSLAGRYGKLPLHRAEIWF